MKTLVIFIAFVWLPTGQAFAQTAFKHTATRSNINGNITTISNAAADGRADVILIVTSDYGNSGPYHNKSIGVWYNNGKWTIFNQDRSDMTLNAKFNVLVLEPSANTFMNKATIRTNSRVSDCIELTNTTFTRIDYNNILQSQKCFSKSPINGSNNNTNRLRAGTILFYQTNEGRLGKMEILEYGYNIHLRCVTYNQNGTVHRQNNNLTIRGTWSGDLDNAVEASDGKDLWWQQVTSVERYLTSQNNAKFWIAKAGNGI